MPALGAPRPKKRGLPPPPLKRRVAASKGLAADTGYSVVYEIQIGTNPPQLTFRASVSGANQLQLEVNSDTALTTLRGRQMLI